MTRQVIFLLEAEQEKWIKDSAWKERKSNSEFMRDLIDKLRFEENSSKEVIYAKGEE